MKKHISQAELQRRLAQQRRDLQANKPLPYSVELKHGEAYLGDGWIVYNWKQGWKWLSNWAFALIGYIAVFGVPGELLALFPEASQSRIIGIVAVLGFIFRFVNQTRPRALPAISGANDDNPA